MNDFDTDVFTGLVNLQIDALASLQECTAARPDGDPSRAQFDELNAAADEVLAATEEVLGYITSRITSGAVVVVNPDPLWVSINDRLAEHLRSNGDALTPDDLNPPWPISSGSQT